MEKKLKGMFQTKRLTLDDWTMIFEEGKYYLTGKIRHCTFIHDGEHIKTSQVIFFDGKTKEVRTLNRWWKLGSPSERMEEVFKRKECKVSDIDIRAGIDYESTH